MIFKICDQFEEIPEKTIKSKELLICLKKQKVNSIYDWIDKQTQKINSIDCEMYLKLSQNKHIKQYIDDFLENNKPEKKKEKKIDYWEKACELLFTFCEDNKELPSKNFIHTNKKKVKILENQNAETIHSWLIQQTKKIKDIDCELYKKLSKNIYVKEHIDNYLKKIEIEEKIKVKNTEIDQSVWNKYIGKHIKKSQCWCCGCNEITQSKFYCCPVLSEADHNLNNLRPVCRKCNKNIGDNNIMVYVEILVNINEPDDECEQEHY